VRVEGSSGREKGGVRRVEEKGGYI